VIDKSALPQPKTYNTRLFVGNVPFDCTAERLADLFDGYGIVIEASVPTDPASGKAIGYGFVTMAHEKHCKAAIEALDGSTVGERRIEVRLADVKPKTKPVRPRRRAGPPPARKLMGPGNFAPPSFGDGESPAVRAARELQPGGFDTSEMEAPPRPLYASPRAPRPAASAPRSFVVEKRRLGPPTRRV
jgi:RNA recognition motif-containing protein